MTRLLWSSNFRLGIDGIDAQHKYFLELINQLEEVIIAKDPNKIVKKCVSDIYDCAREHFCAEEEMLVGCHYPDLEERKEYHERFLGELDYLMHEKFKKPDIDAYCECYDYIYTWFLNHIQEKDPLYLDYVNIGQVAA